MAGMTYDGLASTQVLSAQFSGNVVETTNISGTNAVFGGQQIGNAEIGIGAVSGNVVGSGGLGLMHLANASVSGLHLIAQGIGADRILNASLTATQMANASVSGLIITAQGVGADRILNAALTATQMANNAASGAIVSSEYGTIKTGSPAGPGNSLLAGSGQTSAGSSAWILFPSTAFKANPDVFVQAYGAAGVTFLVAGGSINAGSFYVESSAASTGFRYLACGSGRL